MGTLLQPCNFAYLGIPGVWSCTKLHRVASTGHVEGTPGGSGEGSGLTAGPSTSW